MNKRFYKNSEIEILEGDIVYYDDKLKGNHEYYIAQFNVGSKYGTCALVYNDFSNGLRSIGYVPFDELIFKRRKEIYKKKNSMKICVNGNLIDLKKIYMIGNVSSYYMGSYKLENGVVEYYLEFHFEIYFINNNKSLRVGINRSVFLENEHKSYIDSNDYKKYSSELELFRQQIVELWSDNQSEYPQFNIEKYTNNILTNTDENDE